LPDGLVDRPLMVMAWLPVNVVSVAPVQLRLVMVTPKAAPTVGVVVDGVTTKVGAAAHWVVPVAVDDVAVHAPSEALSV
jgi:methyl coenzyme M reductase subunit C